MKTKCIERTNDKGITYLKTMKPMILGIVLCAASTAFGSKQTVTPVEVPKVQPAPAYRVPLLTEGVRLSDFAGMKPRPELKESC